MVPSWIVWRELDRVIRSYGKADDGNLTDLMLAPLALYLEKVQVDRRISTVPGERKTPIRYFPISRLERSEQLGPTMQSCTAKWRA
jgi:hypothetical protein